MLVLHIFLDYVNILESAPKKDFHDKTFDA